jgi:DNA-binding transcriptional LysR family regulator
MPKRLSETRISRRLRFRDLEVFFAVVRCGGMAKAAAELGVTQPAVSGSIAELEDAFAVRLFDRTRQGVIPTIYGRTLLKRGLASFDELKQGIRDLEFLADPAKGEVRIGCPESIAGAILAPMVQRFCDDYPGIDLTIESVPTPNTELPELHARKLDVVLVYLSKPQADDPFGDDLCVEILFDDEAVIAAGTNSRWARRRKIKLADLLDASWVGTPRQTFTTTVVEQAFQASNLPVPKMRVMTFSVQVRVHLLATTDFLSAMPKSMLRINPECNGLRELPIRLPSPPFPVAIVTLKGRTLTPAVELFLDSLRMYAKSFASM